jgi:hypothetical protein
MSFMALLFIVVALQRASAVRNLEQGAHATHEVLLINFAHRIKPVEHNC